ncbi:MAG: hypothetical protein WA005_08995, partial [Candidatus Binataceae bacterium]
MPQPLESNDASDSSSTPDIILPSQYFELTGSRRPSSEQRLMLAVLVDAINLLQSARGAGTARRSTVYGEARQWVFAPSNDHAFSFDNVCDGLGIDPVMLRERLANLGSRTAPIRLRLKESGRAQRVTVNRVRRRRSR